MRVWVHVLTWAGMCCVQLSEDTTVVVRTTIHSVHRRRDGEPAYISFASLNEWDPKIAQTEDYRMSLDNQRGNILAIETKNNTAKMAKFTLSALLAGADSLRLGFVSRTARTDPDNHVILGVSSFVPESFAAQVAVNVSNAWGVVRWLIDTVRKHAKNLQAGVDDEEYIAKFVLMRDPYKPVMRLYNVPIDAFDRPEEDVGDDDQWGAAESAVADA